MNRAAADARTNDLAAHLPRLTTRLDAADPPGHPGFLDGAAGDELAKHTAGQGSLTSWDACLLTTG
ncbi:hypothetical protein [Murinocardiopsis flavida]|uniref:hypothetical protein n=1 Tax=Murinocardiopsis flavida TaxID=645275 RepID=UPI000D0CD721|nr:hypothetical protein [Murinocardiopsis flavida]